MKEPEQVYDSMPKSVEDLEELLDRLDSYLSDKKKLISTATISELFETLSAMYEDIEEEAEEAGWDDDEELPVTIGDLEMIYRHIETLDHTSENEFDGREKTDPADTLELTILFDRLAEHYASDNKDLELFENGVDL